MLDDLIAPTEVQALRIVVILHGYGSEGADSLRLFLPAVSDRGAAIFAPKMRPASSRAPRAIGCGWPDSGPIAQASRLMRCHIGEPIVDAPPAYGSHEPGLRVFTR